MRVVELHIENFRGWADLTLKPAGHLLVVGEPRAGRSDLIEALRRVLDPDLTRTPPDEFDVLQPGPARTPGATARRSGHQAMAARTPSATRSSR